MTSPSLASLGYPCPSGSHSLPPKVFPYFREPDGKGSLVALYVCLDCRGGFVVTWYGPVPEEQAKANKRLLHREVGEWLASRSRKAGAA